MRAGLDTRLAAAESARVVVASAGTWGHEGASMEPNAATALAELDVDAAGFRARALDADLVAGADLVLAATREHRAAAVQLVPQAATRAFTLFELARLVRAVEPDGLPTGDVVARGTALVRAAHGRRGLVRAEAPHADDLEDPYGAPLPAFRGCAALVSRALADVLDLLAGPPRG